MSVTYDEFIKEFPEFSDIDSSIVAEYLQFSIDFLNVTIWDKWYAKGVKLYTAHNLAIRYNIESKVGDLGLNSPTDSVGVANNLSASNGSLSQGLTLPSQLSSDSSSDSYLARSIYGIMYMSLRDAVVPLAVLC